MKTSIFLWQAWVVLTQPLPTAGSYKSNSCWLCGSQQLLHITYTPPPSDLPPFHKQSTSPPPAPAGHQPHPNPDRLCSTSTSQHFSKTIKPSDRQISSHDFPNLSTPGQVQRFPLLLWSPPVPKSQTKKK